MLLKDIFETKNIIKKKKKKMFGFYVFFIKKNLLGRKLEDKIKYHYVEGTVFFIFFFFTVIVLR